jgi:hypothetical protein
MRTDLVEIHEEAAAEHDASFDWYLQRSEDAALAFDREVGQPAPSPSMIDPKLPSRRKLRRTGQPKLRMAPISYVWLGHSLR